MKKIIALMLLSALLLSGCAETTEHTGLSGITVDILDIGRADCIIIRCGGHTAVIDTGEDTTSPVLENYLADNGITAVDALFITHYDSDHIGGVPVLLTKTECPVVYTPNYVKDSKNYLLMEAAIKASGAERVFLTAVKTLDIGGATFTVYPPVDMTYQDGEDNEFSLVINVTYGSRSFLFMGDALSGRIQEVIGSLSDCDVIKMPNHGDYNGNLQPLLAAVTPEFAVITCSEEEKPSNKTVNLLTDGGITAYLTLNGAIRITSDGSEIDISQ
jgi:competence protein ComEC